MPITVNSTIPIDCYDSGNRRRLPLANVHQRLWDYHYGWLLPIDWYRWAVESSSDSAYICEHMKPAARRFGLHLHTRGTRALTVDDLAGLEEREIGIRNFHQRAARFNKLFGDLPSRLRPFFFYEIDNPGVLPCAAYRMHPSRTWLVVVGVTKGAGAGAGVGDEDVDWSLLQQRPGALKTA